MDPIAAMTPTPIRSTAEQNKLRETINEVVGVTFFAPMLKTAHDSVLKGKYGHGGRGEEAFQGQLDMEFARSIGRGVKTDLAEALYRKLARQV